MNINRKAVWVLEHTWYKLTRKGIPSSSVLIILFDHILMPQGMPCIKFSLKGKIKNEKKSEYPSLNQKEIVMITIIPQHAAVCSYDNNAGHSVLARVSNCALGGKGSISSWLPVPSICPRALYHLPLSYQTLLI